MNGRGPARAGALIAVVAALAGCTQVRPTPGPTPPVGTTFPHEALGRVLAEFADSDGRLAYAELKRRPDDLEAYYRLAAAYSPDSHPDLFPTEADRLAYWLNAYNAAAIKIVLDHYPVESVRDVGLLPLAGFFYFRRPIFGGRAVSLYRLENDIVRPRFGDPRVHFALNCASRGCPRLPREPFDPARLNEQLDREARRFMAEERNLQIDHEARTVTLSSVFDWHRSDFPADLLQYAALYLPEDRGEALAAAADYEVEYRPYDWRLNDQAGDGTH